MYPNPQIYLCIFLLIVACGPKDNAHKLPDREPREIATTETKEVMGKMQENTASHWAQMNVSELKTELNSLSSPRDIEKMSKIAGAIATKQTDSELRNYSNALWAGSNGLNRNRPASTALAKISFEKTPETWSQLRTGIGYLNGTGIEQDSDKAAQLLSEDRLENNAAAAYFLSLVYKQSGNIALERAALYRARDLGHKRALSRLAEIEE